MLRASRAIMLLSTAFVVALVFAPVVAAQQADTARPSPGDVPVPAQIAVAKKVFISNTGVDAASLAAFRKVGDPDYPYKQFYAAMKSWGHYELVSAPADADLVLEIQFAAPVVGTGDLTAYAPHLRLTIVDPTTRLTLWTLAEPVQGAFRKSTFVKNVNTGVANLVNDVAKLAGQPPAFPPAPKKQDDAGSPGPP